MFFNLGSNFCIRPQITKEGKRADGLQAIKYANINYAIARLERSLLTNGTHLLKEIFFSKTQLPRLTHFCLSIPLSICSRTQSCPSQKLLCKQTPGMLALCSQQTCPGMSKSQLLFCWNPPMSTGWSPGFAILGPQTSWLVLPRFLWQSPSNT